jgi:hypothetical protein
MSSRDENKTTRGSSDDPPSLHPGGRHQVGEGLEIVLEAQRSAVPPLARLKGLLKAALRTWGLRCLSVRDVTPKLPPLPPAGRADGAAGCGDR